MPTYNAAAVSDTAIAHKKGISLQQGRALRDNPLAIAEGSTGAPYNLHHWHPYDSLLVGDGNDGTIYDFSVDGAVATAESPDFVSGYSYAFVFYDLAITGGTGTADFRWDAYSSAASTWIAADNIFTALVTAQQTAGVNGGPLAVLRPLVSSNLFDASTLGGVYSVGGGTNSSVSAGGGAWSTYSAADTTFTKVRFRSSTGSIGGGSIKMLRRVEYW